MSTCVVRGLGWVRRGPERRRVVWWRRAVRQATRRRSAPGSRAPHRPRRTGILNWDLKKWHASPPCAVHAHVVWGWSELATRSVGRVASARACLRSAAETSRMNAYLSSNQKHVAALKSITQGQQTTTARSCIARVQYSMRHACSTRLFGRANVRKTRAANSGHRLRAAVLLSIRRWRTCHAPCCERRGCTSCCDTVCRRAC